MFTLDMKNFKSVFTVILAVSALLYATANSAAEALETDNDGVKKVEVKQASNLIMDGREASKKQVPVLIMFSTSHCGYCRQVEEDFLKPMLRNTEYEDKVLIRKIVLDSSKSLIDFKGKRSDPEELSDEYHVSMVPTLILFDASGKRLSDPIIGLANPYYYGGELDAAIDTSLLKIRALAQR